MYPACTLVSLLTSYMNFASYVWFTIYKTLCKTIKSILQTTSPTQRRYVFPSIESFNIYLKNINVNGNILLFFVFDYIYSIFVLNLFCN